MHCSPTCSVREQRIKKLKPLVCQEFCDDDKTIFKIHLASKLRHLYKDKRPYVLAKEKYNLSLKCRVSTTATVQFAVNYMYVKELIMYLSASMQMFHTQYSVLSRLISNTMVYCMTFKIVGFFIILPLLFAQLLSYNYEKTNRSISTKLFQNLGSCLKWMIFTSNHLSNERQLCYITLCNTTSNMIIQALSHNLMPSKPQKSGVVGYLT